MFDIHKLNMEIGIHKLNMEIDIHKLNMEIDIHKLNTVYAKPCLSQSMSDKTCLRLAENIWFVCHNDR